MSIYIYIYIYINIRIHINTNQAVGVCRCDLSRPRLGAGGGVRIGPSSIALLRASGWSQADGFGLAWAIGAVSPAFQH